MSDDLVQILLYVVIGVIGVIASAYQNKQKRKQAGPQPPRDVPASPIPGFGPDMGPLIDIFDIPRKMAAFPPVPTVEESPTVEDGGQLVDTPVSEIELAGIKMAEENKRGEELPPEISFEEGQSDIQKMIAKYEAIQRELDKEYDENSIAAGEIVSVEDADAARAMLPERERIFNLRKAIIYSEILKRKEY